MNIKYAIGRLLGVKDSMVNKGWEDTVTFKELKYILEGLDEPMEYPKFTYDIIREGIFKENEILKSELANAKQCNKTLSDMLARANGLVKNLEETKKNLEDKISNYWKGGFVAFKEYDELNSNYKKAKEIAQEFSKRLQNVNLILYPNPEKGN